MGGPAQSRTEQRIVNTQGNAAGTSSNPANETFDKFFKDTEGAKLVVGTITKMGVGCYDAIVETSINTDLECICASPLLVNSPFRLGTNAAPVYAEGSTVAVMVISPVLGVILCALPNPLPDEEDIKGAVTQMMTAPEGEVSKQELAYDDKVVYEVDQYRPRDTVPGDITWLNEMLVGMGVFKLMTFIRASERAKLEMFMFDDEVRLTSGHFQHNNSASRHNIYNDNGFNTDEFIGSHHQCEMFGRTKYGSKMLQNDKYDYAGNANTNLKYKNPGDGPYVLGRYHSYLGYMGGIFSFFVSNPEPKEDLKLTEQTKDEGLFHTFIDGSGRLLVRSAGGICLQRTDRISVPKKIAQPWYKGEGPAKPTKKLPFEWDSTHPYARHLQLRDAFAWYTKNSYQRFIENNTTYYVPNVPELKTPRDEYDSSGDDPLGQEKFNDSKHKDAMSFVHLGEDGSIIIRGKCGEEIRMAGGNITISCPGNIEIRPGKSAITLAGHDAIIKGKESVDISATSKDVRVKAQYNLQMHSNKGGVLLESAAENDNQVYDKKEGEDVVTSGIVLKAEKSRVYAWGQRVQLASTEKCLIEAYKQGKTALEVVVPTIRMVAFNGSASIKTKDTALNLTENQATLVGNSAYVSGTQSSGVFMGEKYLVPITQAPTGLNPHKKIMEGLNQQEKQLNNSDNIGKPYTPGEREKIKFTFRTTEQCGTNTASEVYAATKFVVYETSWAFLKKAGTQFIQGSLDKWKEEPVNDTYPWPGKDCYNSDCLVELQTEENIQSDKLKAYDAIKPKSGSLSVVSMHALTIMKP